jgi:hypothetical protein
MGNENRPDLQALKTEILACHQTSIDAHCNKDINYFIRDVADGYLSVSNGEIRIRTIEEIEAQFKDYLQNTTFTEYKDLCEPIVGVSNDGSMAWLIAQTKIAGNRRMDDGSELALDFTCAYIMLYEHRGDAWVRVGDISTFK